MEKFVVSARKYRPVGFDEVVGQSHVTIGLENALATDRLGHALLFCGPRGVGKTTCARILAKKINDFEAEPTDNTFNFNVFELDAASNNSVDDIRTLTEQVRYPPQVGKFKVYIIDEVHMLSTQAFNAFLKTLEEPPAYVMFILATTEKHKVIPTILSRCRIYDFNRIEIIDIVNQLKKIAEKEHIKAEEDALHLIAEKADGAMRDALSMFDLIVAFSENNDLTRADTIKNLHILDYDYYFQITELLLQHRTDKLLLLFDQILKKGFDGHNFLIGLQQHVRNVLVAQNKDTAVLLEVSDNLKAKYFEQARAYPPHILFLTLNICNQFELNYKLSKNQRLHIELCLIKLSQIETSSKATEPSIEDKKKTPIHEITAHKDTATLQKSNKEQVEPPLVSKVPYEPSKKETPTIQLPATEKVTPDNPTVRNEHFSEELLQSAWDKFIKQAQDSGKINHVILTKKITKQTSNNVSIHLSNELELSLIKPFENEILQFLRDDLKNDHLTLDKKIQTVRTQKIPYTSKEILDFMKDENPMLDTLITKLKLEAS